MILILAVIDPDWGIGKWLGELIQRAIDAIKGIWAALWDWIAAKGDLMAAWLVNILPPGDPFVDALIDQGESIWEFFFKFIHPAGYFIHFPTLSIMLVIIFSVEGPLFLIQVYLFVKRLIPVA